MLSGQLRPAPCRGLWGSRCVPRGAKSSAGLLERPEEGRASGGSQALSTWEWWASRALRVRDTILSRGQHWACCVEDRRDRGSRCKVLLLASATSPASTAWAAGETEAGGARDRPRPHWQSLWSSKEASRLGSEPCGSTDRVACWVAPSHHRLDWTVLDRACPWTPAFHSLQV